MYPLILSPLSCTPPAALSTPRPLLPTLQHPQLLHISYRGTTPGPLYLISPSLSFSLVLPVSLQIVPTSSTPQFNGQRRRPDAATRLRPRVYPWGVDRRCRVGASEADSICVRCVSVNPLLVTSGQSLLVRPSSVCCAGARAVR